ncbi:MAG: YqaJ viral recombinase family protein [Armatimonadetes bacterium]|nr:YqaJ viral recombinase family protein [Armatimonadota bacterium]
MSAVLNPLTDREAWLDARRRCITATDVSAIVRKNPYSSPLDVYLVKTGQKREPEQTGAMEWGLRLEEVIARKFADKNGVEPRPAGFMVKEDEPIFGATPDYYITTTHGDQDETALLECKTCNFFVGKQEFGEEHSDHVPDRYVIQCQWQLMVTGRKVCHLAVLIAGSDYREYTIERNEELILNLQLRARTFWHEYVMADNPPPLTGDKADTDWLKGQFPEDDGGAVRATEAIEKEVDALGTDLRALKALGEVAEGRKNRIKQFMGEASVLDTSQGAITWRKAKDGQKTDWKAVAAALGASEDLIMNHTSPTKGSRRFIVPKEVTEDV